MGTQSLQNQHARVFLSTCGLRGTEDRFMFHHYLKASEFTAVDASKVHGAVQFLLLFSGAYRIFTLSLGNFVLFCSLF